MITDAEDSIIRFSPDDVPDLPEIPRRKKQESQGQEPRRQDSEPAGWRPLGMEWESKNRTQWHKRG